MEIKGFYTQRGLTLSAGLLAGDTLTITRVTAGCGQTAASASALAQERQTLAVNTPTHNGAAVSIPATLAAAQAAADYALTELGVYAKNEAQGEILYKIYRLDEPVRIAADSRMVLRFYLEETVSEDLNVTVACSPAGLVTEAQFLPVLEKVTAVGAPGASAVVAAADLQAYLDALPRYLSAQHVITVSGAADTVLQLQRFFGSGSITIRAAALGEATLGGAEVSCCQTPVFLTNMQFREPEDRTGNLDPLVNSDHADVELNNCAFVDGRNVASAFGAERGGRLLALNCSTTGYRAVVNAAEGGVVTLAGAASSFTPGSYGACVWEGGLVIVGSSEISDTLGASTNYKRGGGIITYSGTLA